MSQRGQATLEYAAVLAVVATVLALGGAFVGGGAIFNGVLGGIQRALCLVTGGSCAERELEACTVRKGETVGELGVKLTFVTLGKGLTLGREEKSDGSVEIRLIAGSSAGLAAALGASGGVQVGGKGAGTKLMAEAEVLARLGRSRSWTLPNAAAADRLTRTIVKRVAADGAADALASLAPPVRVLRGIAHAAGFDGDEIPTADVDGVEVGIEGAAAAGLGDAAAANLGLGRSIGGTRDRATGQVTFVLVLDGEAGAQLTLAAGGAEFSGAGESTVELKLDRRGEPLELTVSWAASGGGGYGLAARAQTAKARNRRTEARTKLDLGEPANRAVFDRFAHGLTPRGVLELPGAIVALGERLRTAGESELARYEVAESTHGAEGEAALGAGVGLSAELTRSTSTLQDAWSRPAGGVWQQRLDCLAKTA